MLAQRLRRCTNINQALVQITAVFLASGVTSHYFYLTCNFYLNARNQPYQFAVSLVSIMLNLCNSPLMAFHWQPARRNFCLHYARLFSVCLTGVTGYSSMFRRFYIQKVLCSEGSMFRNICSEGPMFRKYGWLFVSSNWAHDVGSTPMTLI